MRKRWLRRVLIILVLIAGTYAANLIIDQKETLENNQQVSTRTIENELIYPGGMTIGIYMETDGVLVLDTESIESSTGTSYEPAKNLVKPGDYILAINGEEIDGKKELIQAVRELASQEVVLTIRRENECMEVKFDCIQIGPEEYKLGIWVRDSVQGLGTVTYIKSDNTFAALGHGIHDSDTDDLLKIEAGAAYRSSIVGIKKGKEGAPGGLEGVIVYSPGNILGSVDDNKESGIYGTFDSIEETVKDIQPMAIGQKQDIESGNAVIRCAIDGEIKEYDIKIKSVDFFARDENKGIVIEIVDKKLLELTGGIVQGMSGSPIIQNGKLVGAVTHVLVNDPTRGYGIFIEEML